MRAFQLASQGESATLVKCDRPEPARDEIRLKIEACGLNFGDLLMIEGTYQERPALPFTLGMEPAGVVDAVGKIFTLTF
jgi:NADPH2:quinone reductase